MGESQSNNPGHSLPQPSLRRDAMVVTCITVASVFIAAQFELSESLHSVTQRWERWQLDEWLFGVLALTISLMWLLWRRHGQAQRELVARRDAELRLNAVLAENRQLIQEQVRIQEHERKHLARELHDQLGQYLNAIKLDAMSICEQEASDTTFPYRSSRAIIQNVDHVHGVVADMIRRLRPVGLDELGLVAAIEHCVDQWRQRLTDTQFLLTVRGTFGDLSESLALTVFRVIQESLTNAYKHADARRIMIMLERLSPSGDYGDCLQLTIVDDGRGMNPDMPTFRSGLSGMRERVAMLGGELVMSSAPGCGMSLETRLPINPAP